MSVKLFHVVQLRTGQMVAVLSCALLSAMPLARGDSPVGDIGRSLEDASGRMNSVVVVREKSASAERPALDDGLEPISEYADQEPELADPQDVEPLPHFEVGDADEINVEELSIEGDNATPAEEQPVETIDEPTDLDPVIEFPGDEPTVADVETDDATETRSDDQTRKPSTNDIGAIYASEAQPEPALFHGMQPGVSTKSELLAEWGEADETSPTGKGELLTYQMRPFQQVDVLIEDGTVALLRVEFAQPEDYDTLQRKVQIEALEPVELTDDASGNVLGYAFPERGLVLVLAGAADVTPTDETRIEQMMLQPLDAQAFALRAERRPISEITANLRDLKQSIELDESNAHAYWLLAGNRLAVGQADVAHEAATKAVELDSQNSAYKLRVAQSLIGLGQYDQAVLMTRELLDDETVADNIRAEAFHVMGKLAALGEADIAEKAIGFHSTAIDLADKLASSGDMLERRAAKRLLVSAHLAIAREVARRDFDNKIESMSQWVGRASGIAEDAIDSGDAGLELRLDVACQSLACLVNIKPARDPNLLLEEIESTFEEIEEATNDPLWLDEIQWRMGVAQMRAVQMEHHRRETQRALKHKDSAVKFLAAGAETRRSSPETERIVGRLYFHIGALYAVHRSNHAEAVKWYDKAEPLLTAEQPESTLYVPRRDGEALVSMAVSYWDQDDYDHAVDLTTQGAELIEQAVAAGVVDEQTLAVPYGNLSVMHKQLGNSDEALKYAKLADASKLSSKKEEQSARRLPQRDEADQDDQRVATDDSPDADVTTPTSTSPSNRSAQQPSNARAASRPRSTGNAQSAPRSASGSSLRRAARSRMR